MVHRRRKSPTDKRRPTDFPASAAEVGRRLSYPWVFIRGYFRRRPSVRHPCLFRVPSVAEFPFRSSAGLHP